MALLRLGHFVISPAGTGEMLASHATLAAAVKDALARAHRHAGGEERRPHMDRCVALGTHSPAAQAALPARPASRRPGAAFSPAKGITINYPEVVDA